MADGAAAADSAMGTSDTDTATDDTANRVNSVDSARLIMNWPIVMPAMVTSM